MKDTFELFNFEQRNKSETYSLSFSKMADARKEHECINCNKFFTYDHKQKRYDRVSVFARAKKDVQTPASKIETLHDVAITPNVKCFICDS